MDAAKISSILKEYKLGVLSYADASLALILIGCNSHEAIVLLDNV